MLPDSSSPAHARLVAGARAVYEHAGIVVTRPFDRPEGCDFMAHPADQPTQRTVVACIASTGPTTHEQIERLASVARSQGIDSVQVISDSTFSAQAIEVGATHGVALTGGPEFDAALARVPESKRPQQLLAPSAPTRPIPPPIPAQHSSTIPIPVQSTGQHATPPVVDWGQPTGKRGGKSLGVKIAIGVVCGVVGFFFIAGIAAALILPQIGRISEISIQHRNAQNIASVAAASEAVGLDFVSQADGDVFTAAQLVATGAVVDDPKSPFHGTYFGVPNLSSDDIEKASQFLGIRSGSLNYTGMDEPNASRKAPGQPLTPVSAPERPH